MTNLNFLHLTDTHILQNYNGSLLEKINGPKGSPTDFFRKILANIKTLTQKPDFILISGDLVHEGDDGDYAYLKKIIEEYVGDIPVYTALGNHDVTAAYWEGYEGKPDCKEKLFYEKDINGYRLIVLDSSHDHSGVGKIDAEQLAWLEDVVKKPSENGSLLVIHHPLESGEVMDGHALTNSQEVLNIIQGTDVIAVLSGHTHQNKVSSFGDILLSTADGTAFGVTVTNETMEMNDRTGFNLCTVDENGLAVQKVRFPDEINPLISFSLQALQEHHS